MISPELLQKLRHDQATINDLRSALPKVSAEERKVLGFEVRAKALGEAISALSRWRSDGLQYEDQPLLRELTQYAKRYAIDQGPEDGSSRVMKRVTELLYGLALNDAKRNVISEEIGKIQAEHGPVRNLAEGMREHLDQVKAREFRSRVYGADESGEDDWMTALEAKAYGENNGR